MSRKQWITVSITGIILVMLILVGLTYAYFLTQIKVNDNIKSISVTTADISVEYYEGNGLISLENMMLGDTFTKTFNVKSTGNKEGYYSISLLNVENELNYNKDLTYIIKRNGITIKEGIFPSSDRKIVFSENILPSNNGECTKENGCINEYELIVTYINAGYDQSVDMNKKISALVQIENKEDVIEINNEEQLYALSKILTYNEVNTRNNLTKEAKVLDENITYTTKDDIINYFKNKTYSINNDLNIKYNTTYGDEYFNGIGCLKYNFEGKIYANNHTIKINYENLQYMSYMQGFGFINYLTNGAIYDLNLKVDSDVMLNNISNTTTSLNPGIAILTGISDNSTYENITVDLNYNFKFDLSSSDKNMYSANMGIICGSSKNINNFNHININLNNSEVLLDLTSSQKNNGYTNSIGLLTGNINSNNMDTRLKINNINVNISESNILFNNNNNQGGAIGGIIGIINNQSLVDITNVLVHLRNSSIKIESENAGNLEKFYALSAGGVIGITGSGSNNTTNLGRKGTIINNVEFLSDNTSKQEVITASENIGGAVNVGSIYGFAFNNSITENVNVKLNNAIIKGERKSENETAATLGVHVGGIGGRFEHTGQIKNSTVNAINSEIIANATEHDNYVGGITGYAFAPLHIDLNPLSENIFNGNGSTIVKLNINPGNNNNQNSYIGSLAGHAHYIINDNTVKNTSVEIDGIKSSSYKSTTILSNYIGVFQDTISVETKFTQRTPEIINPTIENVNLNTNNLDNYITVKKY